jgi:hypothetical protein
MLNAKGIIMNLNKELEIRFKDPRIILNEFFGYLSFSMGLITALLVAINYEPLYQTANQVLLASCGLQNIPLLMVYMPQWRVMITGGILGIVVTNYFATIPIGNAFREGLFVGMIKVDYSYEALVKYHPEKYPHEAELMGKGKFFKNLLPYIKTIWVEMWERSAEMLVEIKKGNWKAFIHDAIRSQFFSSLMRIISATPLFIVAVFELAAFLGYFDKSDTYIFWSAIWTTISVRALAFSSFIDGLSKIAFGFMRESFMMRLGGVIFALAQFYLMLMGEHSLKLVIPLSLAGLAAYPIVEGERLRKLALANEQ